MKRDFQAKFLMHMVSKKQQENEGFTLIELLVVIIIIGILAAIALPSLLGQVNKSKQSEARNNIGAMNRAQQAYALEKNDFAPTLGDLGIGIQKQTANYHYDITPAVTNPGAGINDASAITANRATPVQNVKNLKVYGGLTVLANQTNAGVTEALSLGTVCESDAPLPVGTGTNAGPGAGAFAAPALALYDAANKVLNCPPNYKNLGK